MDLDSIAKIIGDLRPRLNSEFGVSKLFLIGSHARGDASETSDIDFLIAFDRPSTFIEYMDLHDVLEEALGKTVDLVPLESLRPEIAPLVFEEARQVA